MYGAVRRKEEAARQTGAQCSIWKGNNVKGQADLQREPQAVRDAPLRPPQLSASLGIQPLGSESTPVCHSLGDRRRVPHPNYIEEFGRGCADLVVSSEQERASKGNLLLSPAHPEQLACCRPVPVTLFPGEVLSHKDMEAPMPVPVCSPSELTPLLWGKGPCTKARRAAGAADSPLLLPGQGDENTLSAHGQSHRLFLSIICGRVIRRDGRYSLALR
ncbi:uncharacterized protein ACIBXB_002502 [Morphnus guianensis]